MSYRATYALTALVALAVQWPASAAVPNAPADPPMVGAAARPSEAVTAVVDWVLASSDNGGLPYVVVDKVGAEVFVFDSAGQLLGRSPALLGSAIGDDSVPGIGDRELRKIPPGERTTPAGRFVANYGRAAGRQRVLWVDYPSAVSLHAVATGSRRERRLHRLKSPSPEDNRITYGCINVPAAFYREVVSPLLKNSSGIFYILPESRSLRETFWSAAPQG